MNDGDSVLWKEVSEWRSQTREQPGISSDFQIIRLFGVGKRGTCGVRSRDKRDSLGAAGRPVFQQ